jgi:hypothetical protein
MLPRLIKEVACHAIGQTADGSGQSGNAILLEFVAWRYFPGSVLHRIAQDGEPGQLKLIIWRRDFVLSASFPHCPNLVFSLAPCLFASE